MQVIEKLLKYLSYSAQELSSLPEYQELKDDFSVFLSLLENGRQRVAEKQVGQWNVNTNIKQLILLGFRLGHLVSLGNETLSFVDKDTFPLRQFAPDQKIRLVPGGVSVRRGAYLAPTVTVMPPAFVNVGAYIDEGTLIDSHALVGSCAQVGKKVHVSAGAQIGGVLEPVGERPVIIEEDAFIGGNSGIYEGTLIGARAVIGAGVILTRSTRVYDIVHDVMIAATDEKPLEIPAGAVVVPGAREVKGPFAEQHGLSLYTPIIVRYRDAKTDAKTSLEFALR